jgi:glycine dehydrogenase subunit 2
VDARPLEELLPERFRRTEPPRLPEISEPEIVRHYNRLSKRNFDLDTGFYPLGSCTMKHNPKLHERVAALPGNARLHPAQSPERAQGALALMYELQVASGDRGHASRLAAAVGRLARRARGVLLTRAYHEDRGEHRTKVLTPDTAHGTNPATVTMAGYEVVKVGTNADGGVDVEDLRAKADDQVACLMLTNPNTLGLFDRNIEEIASIVTASARPCTTTGRTSTPSWASPARATWASTSSTTTCTRPSPSRTAVAGRVRGRSR